MFCVNNGSMANLFFGNSVNNRNVLCGIHETRVVIISCVILSCEVIHSMMLMKDKCDL